MVSYLVERISHLAVWVVGLVCLIHFLEKFETELKPLVMALILVSMLEAVVQILEWTLRKIWALVKALLWKLWQILGWCCLKCCGCDEDPDSLTEMLGDVTGNWQELRRKWRGEDAGSFTIFRIAAVIGTLTLVGFLSVVVKSLVFEQVNTAIKKFGLYKHQVTSIVAWVSNMAPDVDRLFPGAKDEPMIQQLLNEFKSAMDEVPAVVEGWAVSFLDGILSSLSGGLFSVAFLLLYTAFLLFDPLHINLESTEDLFKVERSRSDLSLKDQWGRKLATRVWRRFRYGQPAPPAAVEEPLLDGANAEVPRQVGAMPTEARVGSREGIGSRENMKHLQEVQVKLYKIIWNYFLLTFVVNAVYAVLNFLLFESLHVDLSVILAAFCFFLSFIPELGTISCMALPLPFILLTPTEECTDAQLLTESGVPEDPKDCIIDFGARLKVFSLVFFGMFVIKVLVSNVLSPKLISSNKVLNGAIKDGHEVSEAHPVIVLFSVVFCGAIWGTIGMFISVPALSVMRMAVNIGREQEKIKQQ